MILFGAIVDESNDSNSVADEGPTFAYLLNVEGVLRRTCGRNPEPGGLTSVELLRKGFGIHSDQDLAEDAVGGNLVARASQFEGDYDFLPEAVI